MNRWLRWIAGWLIVILVYGAANLVLVGGQKLWHRTDEAKLDHLEALLKGERNQIEQLEAQLKACFDPEKACEDLLNRYSESDTIHKAQLKKLDSLNQRVVRLESRVKGCVPNESDCETQYAQYSQTVDTYNSEVRKANALLGRLTTMKPQLKACAEESRHCESLYAEYSNRVDTYNARLPEANALAKRVGSYWYVVPVPKFGSHASAE
jgi:chromosome segregation ATPase